MKNKQKKQNKKINNSQQRNKKKNTVGSTKMHKEVGMIE